MRVPLCVCLPTPLLSPSSPDGHPQPVWPPEGVADRRGGFTTIAACWSLPSIVLLQVTFAHLPQNTRKIFGNYIEEKWCLDLPTLQVVPSPNKFLPEKYPFSIWFHINSLMVYVFQKIKAFSDYNIRNGHMYWKILKYSMQTEKQFSNNTTLYKT